MCHTFESIAFPICYVAIFHNFGPNMIYMQAVHSGADLESAISNCMGYKAEVLSVTGASQPGVPFLAFDKLLISSGSRLHGWGEDKSYIWLAIWISSKVFNFILNFHL
jgi:hypothetical protein